jgi:hypothetical protein
MHIDNQASLLRAHYYCQRDYKLISKKHFHLKRVLLMELLHEQKWQQVKANQISNS